MSNIRQHLVPFEKDQKIITHITYTIMISVIQRTIFVKS